MRPGTSTDTINLLEVSAELRAVDPAAVLLRNRLFRRVLWQHTPPRAHGFGLLKRQHYIIGRDELLRIVEPDELPVDDPSQLPDEVILIARSRDWRDSAQPRDVALLHYWRLLFHARVELAVRARLEQEGVVTLLLARLDSIGRAECREIVSVLQQESYLFDADDRLETYVQFVAQYLELHFFAPQQVLVYFPSLLGRADVEALVTQDVDGAALFKNTRPPGAAEPLVEDDAAAAGTEVAPPLDRNAAADEVDRTWARRAARRGNNVRAAILYTRLGGRGERGALRVHQQQGQEQLRRLAGRLCAALDQPAALSEPWYRVLAPLLPRAARGYWPAEARLLYDLQRACQESETELESVRLWRWLVTLGRQPIRQRVPGQQLVLVLQAFRRAARRLHGSRLSPLETQRLDRALSQAVRQQAERVRQYFRPRLLESLEAVRLSPQHLAVDASRDKLVEELLDRIVGNGLLTMSDLRDAFSRNQLKLDDLAGPVELALGDKLLRLNRELASRLDNIYRPGEFYLRWLQSFSSLLFGTPSGRLLTRFVLLPFLGAFIALKFCFFMYQEVHHFLPQPHEVAAAEAFAAADDEHSESVHQHHRARRHFPWDPLTTPWSLGALGVFLFLMMHAPPFRRAVLRALTLLGRGLRRVFVDAPGWVLRQPAVRAVLDSAPVRLARRVLVKPLLLALAASAIAAVCRVPVRAVELVGGGVFIAAAAFLATRVGRIADEMVANWSLEAVHDLGYQIIPAAIVAVADWFKRTVGQVERLLYGVDEWFRFRRQRNRITDALKSFFGIFWLALSYVFRFLIVLIIEPTVNPVKHFPMVTVAGKFMLLLVPVLPPALKGLGVDAHVAGLLTFLIVAGLPGAFGFLVWELKENWRLYRANRPETLRPVPVGHHGETVYHLLCPGFHSGTVPKAYAKWRRSAQRESPGAGAAAEHQLAHVESAVRYLVERDLLGLLRLSSAGHLRLAPGKVLLGVTQIRLEVGCDDRGPGPLVLGLQLVERRLQLCVLAPGWLDDLAAGDRAVVRFALAGFEQFAGASACGADSADESKAVRWDAWVRFWDEHRQSARPSQAAAPVLAHG